MLIIVEFLKEKGEPLKGMKSYDTAIKSKSSIHHVIAATTRRPQSAHHSKTMTP